MNTMELDVTNLEINDSSIEFNGLAFTQTNADKRDENNIMIAMDNYKSFCEAAVEKERNQLYEKIDKALFELKENQMLIYVPKDMKVIGVKSAFVTKLFKNELKEKSKSRYFKAQILEICCEYKDSDGNVKTEWILLTHYSPTQFIKKIITEEIL